MRQVPILPLLNAGALADPNGLYLTIRQSVRE